MPAYLIERDVKSYEHTSALNQFVGLLSFEKICYNGTGNTFMLEYYFSNELVLVF